MGLRRTRYRGLAKVTDQLCAAFAVANRLRSELVGVLRAAAAAA